MFVDSHCHLHYPRLVDRLDEVTDNMRQAGVGMALTVATTPASFDEVSAMVESRPELVGAVGTHPLDVDPEAPAADPDGLAAYATSRPKIVAIGETGLDGLRGKETMAAQKASFSAHIAAAKAARLPLIVHTRETIDETIDMLQAEGAADVGGVLHCFTGDWEQAQRAFDVNFTVSFSGIVTFKKSFELREVAAKVPAGRYLIETDAPYLAPEPMRGKTNEPSFVYHTAVKVAEARDCPPETVAEESTSAFFALFPKAAAQAAPA